MLQAAETAEQNIIVVRDEETSFFESFVAQYGINWTFEEKQNGILPLSKSYVGYITTPVRTISLKPKFREIGFEHIFRLYLFVYGYRPTDSPAVLDVSSAETSTDVANLFLANLKRDVRQGIIRTYKKVELSDLFVRGRVDYPSTLINHMLGKRKPIETVVSSLSMDNDINALIATALNKLRRVKKFSADALALGMYFDGAKSNVSNGSELLNKISFNSNTSRYRRTLVYAAMIIDQLSYSDVGNTVGTDSFLIDFDALFEDFVAKVLKEMPEQKGFSTWPQAAKYADVNDPSRPDETREYLPDILYRFKPEDERYDYQPSAYAVLDVKNKAYHQFKNPDVYQILTYSKLLHSQKRLLLYPSFSRRLPVTMLLNADVFHNPVIYACFANIADPTGEAFLASSRWFADVVEKTILDIKLN